MQGKMKVLVMFVSFLVFGFSGLAAEEPEDATLSTECEVSALDAILQLEQPLMTPVAEAETSSAFTPLGYCGWNCTDANINGRRCSGSSTTTCTTMDGLCSWCFCQPNGYYLCLE